MAKATFTIGNRFELGGMALVQGNAYGMQTEAETDLIRHTVVHAGLNAGVRLTSGLWLTGYGGRTLYRRYELYDGDDEVFAFEPESTFFFSGSLAFRVGK